MRYPVGGLAQCLEDNKHWIELGYYRYYSYFLCYELLLLTLSPHHKAAEPNTPSDFKNTFNFPKPFHIHYFMRSSHEPDEVGGAGITSYNR